MNEPRVTIAGNLTTDPQERKTNDGRTVVGFTVAVTSRKLVAGEWTNGDPSFYRVTVWDEQSANVVSTLHSGDRVLVYGKLRVKTFTIKENNEQRMVAEIDADEIGPTLRWATCSIKPNRPAPPLTSAANRPGAAMLERLGVHVPESDPTPF